MSTSSNTPNATSQPEAAVRPYTSLIALNGFFDLPMKGVLLSPPDDLDSASMIVHVGKKSKKQSKKPMGDIEPKHDSDKAKKNTASK